jgi:hypothetical protein
LLVDSLAALKQISDNASDEIIDLIACGSTITHLINLHVTYFSNLNIHSSLSRIFANMLSSSSLQVTANLMFQGILDRLHADMNTEIPTLVHEACWASSNITADSSDNVK